VAFTISFHPFPLFSLLSSGIAYETENREVSSESLRFSLSFLRRRDEQTRGERRKVDVVIDLSLFPPFSFFFLFMDRNRRGFGDRYGAETSAPFLRLLSPPFPPFSLSHRRGERRMKEKRKKPRTCCRPPFFTFFLPFSFFYLHQQPTARRQRQPAEYRPCLIPPFSLFP